MSFFSKIFSKKNKNDKENTKKNSIVEKFKNGLSKTRKPFISAVLKILTGKTRLDSEQKQDIEKILIQADISYELAHEMIDALEKNSLQATEITKI